MGLRLQDLELLEVLGKGASSLVRRAVHTPSQTELAVKVINVFDKAKRDQLLRELRTLYSSAYQWLGSLHYFVNKAYRYDPSWIALRVSYGFNGVVVRQADLPSLQAHLAKHFERRPPCYRVRVRRAWPLRATAAPQARRTLGTGVVRSGAAEARRARRSAAESRAGRRRSGRRGCSTSIAFGVLL